MVKYQLRTGPVKIVAKIHFITLSCKLYKSKCIQQKLMLKVFASILNYFFIWLATFFIIESIDFGLLNF